MSIGSQSYSNAAGYVAASDTCVLSFAQTGFTLFFKVELILLLIFFRHQVVEAV